ncbi:MAG: carboxypeptidase-like regulatory domain-containing protein [Paludibacter sp.]|nr:carboxypeptidase-like regulatory domain-containing protein [Paludibacter sp.]
MKKLTLSIIVILIISGIDMVSAKEFTNQQMSAEITIADNQVKGIVYDKSTRESLAGVAVSFNDQKVYTDLDGKFVIPNAGPDKKELRVSMISYEDQILVVDPLKDESVKIALYQQ